MRKRRRPSGNRLRPRRNSSTRARARRFAANPKSKSSRPNYNLNTAKFARPSPARSLNSRPPSVNGRTWAPPWPQFSIPAKCWSKPAFRAIAWRACWRQWNRAARSLGDHSLSGLSPRHFYGSRRMAQRADRGPNQRRSDQTARHQPQGIAAARHDRSSGTARTRRRGNSHSRTSPSPSMKKGTASSP